MDTMDIFIRNFLIENFTFAVFNIGDTKFSLIYLCDINIIIIEMLLYRRMFIFKRILKS